LIFLPRIDIQVAPNNALDTMTEGIGSGMVRHGRGAGNLVVTGLNKILPSDPTLSNLITGRIITAFFGSARQNAPAIRSS
jgi:hypothetical protein